MRPISLVIMLALACACFADFEYSTTLRGDEAEGWKALSHPMGIYVSDTSVYVADTYNNRVLIFEKNLPVSSFGMQGTGSSSLDSPNDVCAGPSGRMFIADSGNDRIQIYRSGSYFDAIYARSVSDVYALSFPYGVDSSQDYIFVSDTNKNRVQVFRMSDYFYAFSIGRSGFGDGEFLLPKGIYYANDRVYIADSGNDRIQIIFANGTFERSIRGTDESVLRHPSDVGRDDEGRIFVADTDNNRVVVFSESGKAIETLGSKGSGKYEFSEPGGIYIKGNRIYVSDTGNNRVQVFKYSPPADSPSNVFDTIKFANSSATLADSARAAAIALGADAPRENYSKSLDDAYTLYSLGRYPEALQKAIDSATSSRSLLVEYNSLSEAKGRQILAEISTLISTVKQDAKAYSIYVDASPYDEKLQQANALMDDRKYPEASAAISELRSSVLSLRSFVDGKKSSTSSERDRLLLEIADAKNQLDALSSLSVQYSIGLDVGEAEALLAGARTYALNLSLIEARASLSSAMEKINSANSSVSSVVSKVANARDSIEEAQRTITRASASSILFQPDLSRAREALSQAEAKLSTDPGTALSLARLSINLANDEASRSSSMDILAFLAILVLVALAAGAVYYVGRKRKKR